MSTYSPIRRSNPLFSIENIATSTPLHPAQKVKKTVTIKSITKKKTPPKVGSGAPKLASAAPKLVSAALKLASANPKLASAAPRVASAAKTKKKWRVAFDENQTQIDAGQKKFGSTECHDCGLLYQQHEPEDEYRHRLHHDTLVDLTHPGWKNERVVGRFGMDYVVLVRHNDSMWLHRTEKIIDLVDKELGYAPTNNKITPNTQAYLYIRKKRIAGCLVAGPMLEGYRLLPEQSTEDVGCVGEEVLPVKCGVSRIWTAKKQRLQNVAKNLMQTMRLHFIPGKVLSLDDIAFAMPLHMEGRTFLERYCRRRDFLVYFGLAI